MRIDMDEALGRRQQQFGYLEQLGRHDKAECYYGLSCLAAVQSSVDEAIKFLKDCFREVGNEAFSNSYVNRAKMDEHLDEIRAEPRFRRLVYERPNTVGL